MTTIADFFYLASMSASKTLQRKTGCMAFTVKMLSTSDLVKSSKAPSWPMPALRKSIAISMFLSLSAIVRW